MKQVFIASDLNITGFVTVILAESKEEAEAIALQWRRDAGVVTNFAISPLPDDQPSRVLASYQRWPSPDGTIRQGISF